MKVNETTTRRKGHAAQPNDSTDARTQRIILYVTFALVVIVLGINVFDSTLFKTPLLWVGSALIVAVFLTNALRTADLTFRTTATDVPVLLYLLVTLVSYSAHTPTTASRSALLLSTGCIVWFFAGTNLFRGHLRQLIDVIACITAGSCLVALVQVAAPERTGLDFFIDSAGRIGGTFGNPSFFGGYIALVVPLFVGRFLVSPRNGWTRWGYAALLVTLAFLLVRTSTRSSVIAATLALLLFALIVNGERRRTLALVSGGLLVAMVALAVAMPATTARLTGYGDPTSSLTRRSVIWSAGLHAFAASPLPGHGPGSFERVMRDFRAPDYWISKSEDLVPHAHNEIVETAVDLGLVGLIPFLLIPGMAFARGFAGIGREPRRNRILAAGVLCALAGILIDGLANVALRQAPVAGLTWLLLGIASAGFREEESGRTIRMRVRVPRPVIALPLLLWAAGTGLFGYTLWGRIESDSYAVRGLTSTIKHENEQAISWYGRAVAVDVTNHTARFNLAADLLTAGRPAEALGHIRTLASMCPNYPKLSLLKAFALYRMDSLSQSRAAIGEELTVRSHPEAWYVASLVYGAQHDTVQEHASLEALLRADALDGNASHAVFCAQRLVTICTTPYAEGHVIPALTRLAHALPADTDLATLVEETRRWYDGKGIRPR